MTTETALAFPIGARLNFEPTDMLRKGARRGLVVVRAHGRGYYVVEAVSSGWRFTAMEDELSEVKHG